MYAERFMSTSDTVNNYLNQLSQVFAKERHHRFIRLVLFHEWIKGPGHGHEEVHPHCG